MKTRALRRLLTLTISLVPIAVVACSSPEAHPPVLGGCIGLNCPPSQGRGGSSGSSDDGGASGDSSTGGGGTGDGGTTTDSGGTATDSGLGGD